MSTALTGCPVLEGVVGNSTGFIGFVWDQPCSGESQTAPHTRLPPLQKDTLKMYVNGILMTRAETAGDMTLKPGDMFILTDGGRRGLVSQLMRPFTDTPEKSCNKTAVKRRRVLAMGYEQESLQKRRHTIRGVTTQLESFYVVAGGSLLNQMPTRKRKHFAEASPTNKGNLIAPVPVPGLAECWNLPWATKKDLLGNFRMAVGGKTDEEDADVDDNAADDDAADEDDLPPALDAKGARKARRKDRDEGVEPVFYQSMKSVAAWEEVLHSLCITKALVVLTAGDGNVLLAALKLNIPVIAFCLSPEHITALNERLVKQYMDMMADPASPFYVAEYATLFGSKDDAAEAKKTPNDKTPTPTAKAQMTPKAKAQTTPNGKEAQKTPGAEPEKDSDDDDAESGKSE